MDEPMLRAWMTESVTPAAWHETLPGRWVAEPSWPPPDARPRRLVLTDEGLREEGGALTRRPVSSPLTLGRQSGQWCPFGRGEDQAGDQREDDALSLVFETPPLDAPVEILGASVLALDVASDRPIATLVARLCDVHPSGESLRVSFGVLNLTHRDSHESPSPLVPGQRYRVRIKLNDAGARFPVGHRIRLALSTAYWPMVWPAPETATVTILGGTLDLPVRAVHDGEELPPLPPPEMAPADVPTKVRPGVVRFDRIGLEVGTHGKYRFDIDEGDPLSAVAEMEKTETVARGDWQVRIETAMRLTCTRDMFRLTASLRVWESEAEICHRDWDRKIPRDLV